MEKVTRDSTGDILKDMMKWALESDATRNNLERQGKRVLHQFEITTNGKAKDFTIYRNGSQYTVRVNGSDVITSRMLDTAISGAEKRGYLDDVTSMELRRGKAAADRLRQIKRIRFMLERR